MSDREQIKALAELIIALNKNFGSLMGQTSVFGVAVYALVRTHPDPQAYASAFRAAWMRHGQRHADSEQPDGMLEGIDAALALVEGASRVPLNVRAPSAASPPDV